MRQVCETIAGLFVFVAFIVGWAATGDFITALYGLLLLVLVLGAVFLVVDVVGFLTKDRPSGLVLVLLGLLGVSWLLGGEEDDLDC